MNFNINWKEPNEVRKLIKTLELTHPYQTLTDDKNRTHTDNVKYLEADLNQNEPVTITLFKEPTSNNEKMIIETDTHGIAFDKDGNELNNPILKEPNYKQIDTDFGGMK